MAKCSEFHSWIDKLTLPPIGVSFQVQHIVSVIFEDAFFFHFMITTIKGTSVWPISLDPTCLQSGLLTHSNFLPEGRQRLSDLITFLSFAMKLQLQAQISEIMARSGHENRD